MTIGSLAIQHPAWLLLLLLVPLAIMLRRWIPLLPGSRVGRTLRTAQIVMIVAVLANPAIATTAQSATTIFLLDRSDSVALAGGTGIDTWLESMLAGADQDARASVIGFAADPTMEAAPAGANSIELSTVIPETGQSATNIADAVDLALAMPVGDQRRIVLVSDGAATDGDTAAAIERARAAGVAVDVVAVPGIDANDTRVVDITAPEAIWQGDPASLTVTVGSGAPDVLEVSVAIDGGEPLSQSVQVQPGTTTLTVEVPPLAAGYHAMQVSVRGNPDLDRIIENNSAPTAIVVRDRPAVLLVAPVGSDPSRLEAALTAQSVDVRIVTPDQVPTALADLAAWDAIVLDNVPSWDFSTAQQNAIVQHTTSGHGLIVIGGTAAYGPGSYAGTPLEDALPVSVKVTDGRQRPEVAVLIVMDTSGSMTYDPASGGQSKLQLAKDGVITAASALSPGDQIGVIAFNDRPKWSLPLTTLQGQSTIDQINASIAPLRAEGGTQLFPALTLAVDSLRNSSADVKHIIVLSDGKSRGGTEASYQELITSAAADNVSVSAVALGGDADIALLQTIAQQGGGRYHFATTPDDIPSITFEEAKSVGSQSVLRGAFTPVQLQPSVILNDIDTSNLPSVDGYNFTEARPNAQVDLSSDRRDPLLARWQLGLGRVVAWTADDGSDFASAWASWPDYDRFWNAAVRWTLPDPNDGALRITTEMDGSSAIVTLDGTQRDGSIMSPSESAIRWVDSAGTAGVLDLTPDGPGRWTATWPNASVGAWHLTIPIANGTQSASLIVPPSAEYQPSPAGYDLLASFAERTGGRVLSFDSSSSADIFDARGDKASAPGTIREVWQWPLGAFLLLYLIELAWRLGWLETLRNRFIGSERVQHPYGGP
jgi:Mg-chelatase subunit ChlD